MKTNSFDINYSQCVVVINVQLIAIEIKSTTLFLNSSIIPLFLLHEWLTYTIVVLQLAAFMLCNEAENYSVDVNDSMSRMLRRV